MKTIFCIAALFTALWLPLAAQPYFYLDPAFNNDGYVIPSYPGNDRGYDLVLQPDGKIITVGFKGTDCLVARFLPNGSPDVSFGSGGTATFQFGALSSILRAVALQADGKIVVAGGLYSKIGVARLLPNGALDATFGTGGKIIAGANTGYNTAALAIAPGGKIVVASQTIASGDYMTTVFRFLPNGAPDTTFSGDGMAEINLLPDLPNYYENALAVLIDHTSGKIIVGGAANDSTQTSSALYRLLDDGTLDPAFGNAGLVRATGNTIFDLVQQPDGKIVAAGYTGDNLLDNDIVVLRFLPGGAPDPAFGANGVVVTDYGFVEAEGVALQPDGKIVVAGYLWSCFLLICDFKFIVGRYNPDGTVDKTFTPTGFFTSDIGDDEELHKVAIQPDGDIVAVGYYENADDEDDLVLLRLTDYLPPAANFDADKLSGCRPLTVKFKDASTGNPETWQWSFPGGTPSSSTEKNPTVVYQQSGKYSVTLSVGNTLGSSTYTSTDYIVVTTAPTASFTAGANGLEVAFTNLSSGATSAKWNFGDGATSTLISPTHAYAAAGTYDVTLIATNSCGSDTVAQEVTVSDVASVGITFVNHAATGANDGSSWADAYVRLQDAIDAAPPGYQIWVAKGVYTPTRKFTGDTTDRYKTFYLSKNVGIYGGFNATETEFSQRDFQNNPTILSGDLDRNDLDPDGNGIVENVTQIKGSNAYHVLWIENVDSTMRLDGFTVTAGYADGSLFNDSDKGGGMYLNGKGLQGKTGPFIGNCRFTGNFADVAGSAVCNIAQFDGHANPVFSSCTFQYNNCQSGAAVANESRTGTAVANPVIVNCVFLNNSGGAVKNTQLLTNTTANISFTNCRFDGNVAGFGGVAYNSNGDIEWTNCSFSNNEASFGGAVYSSGGNLAWTNCSFSRNNAAFGRVVRCSAGDSLRLNNCIIWGNTGSVGADIDDNNGAAFVQLSHTLLESSACPPGFVCGAGMIFNQNPLFADAANGNLRLKTGSPAIDKGNNGAIPAGVATDLDGNVRIFNATGLPLAMVDMGPYEFGSSPTVSTEALASPVGRVRLFPNPTAGIFTIEMEGAAAGDVELAVFDPSGRQIRRETAAFSSGVLNRVFDLSDLPPAFYMLRIQTGGQRPLFAKVLIQR